MQALIRKTMLLGVAVMLALTAVWAVQPTKSAAAYAQPPVGDDSGVAPGCLYAPGVWLGSGGIITIVTGYTYTDSFGHVHTVTITAVSTCTNGQLNTTYSII